MKTTFGGSTMLRLARCLLIAVMVLPATVNGVLAESCRDAVARFAGEYDLQWPKSPVTVESRGVTATDESAPPEEAVESQDGDTAMAEEAPEEAVPDAPTTPEVAPSESQSDSLTAEQRTTMEAFLLEAIKADDAGNSERCFEELGKAKAVSDRT